MYSIATLADMIPWIMAPAFLIAAMVIIAVIVVVMRYTGYIAKVTNQRVVIKISVVVIILHINI